MLTDMGLASELPLPSPGGSLEVVALLCSAVPLDCSGLKRCFLSLQEVCPKRPPQDLQAPHHAGGFWKLLLHFPILQGQGESSACPGCLSPPKLFHALRWRSSCVIPQTDRDLWALSLFSELWWLLIRVANAEVSRPVSGPGALGYARSGNLSSVCSLPWFDSLQEFGFYLFVILLYKTP